MFPGESPGMPDMATQFSIPTVPSNLNRTLFDHMRAMRYLNAMGHMGYSGYGRGGMYGRAMGPQDLFTGPNPGTMDPSVINPLLAQFGQSLPENPSPYALLPNNGFFANHPRVGNALENAIFGAANSGPAETVGEGIQNVARGIIGGQTERARAVNQQFLQPFQTAGMIAQLQGQAANLGDIKSQTNLRNAQAAYYNDKPALEQERINAQAQANYLREQANLFRAQTAQINREQSMSHLSQPVRDELTASGINPWEATPAQVRTALNAVEAYQKSLRTIAPSIAAKAASGRQNTGEGFTDSQRVARANYLHEGDTKSMAAFIQGGGKVEDWPGHVEQHNNAVDQWVDYRRQGGRQNLQQYMSGGGPTPTGPATVGSPGMGGSANAADQAILDFQRSRAARNQAGQTLNNAPHLLPTGPVSSTPNSSPSLWDSIGPIERGFNEGIADLVNFFPTGLENATIRAGVNAPRYINRFDQKMQKITRHVDTNVSRLADMAMHGNNF